jgi:hypothetical protein
MNLLKVFLSKEESIPSLQRLSSKEGKYLKSSESYEWYAPKYVYLYNNYLIALAQGKFMSSNHGCSKYYIYQYREDLGTEKLLAERVMYTLNRKELLEAACRKIDDIILAEEEF